MTHGFFIIMGGFRLFKRSSEKQSDAQSILQEGDDPLHPLLVSDLMLDEIYHADRSGNQGQGKERLAR